MNKRVKTAKLNRDASHRKALLQNMVRSLFLHERIESTTAKLKAVRSFAEKLITRAKLNISETATEKKLHNQREIMKHIHDRNLVTKLLTDIAPRFQNRNGGYTRIIRLANRQSDNSEMALLELVERKSKEVLKDEAIAKRNESKPAPVKKADKKPTAPKKEKPVKVAKEPKEKKAPKEAKPKTTKEKKTK